MLSIRCFNGRKKSLSKNFPGQFSPRKYFNTKIKSSKIFAGENFPIYGIHRCSNFFSWLGRGSARPIKLRWVGSCLHVLSCCENVPQTSQNHIFKSVVLVIAGIPYYSIPVNVRNRNLGFRGGVQ